MLRTLLRRSLIPLVAVAGLAANAFGVMHARAMTQFTEDGTRTAAPEALGNTGRARILISGVRIPRPHATATPADLGWDYDTHWVNTSDGHTLELWTVPGGPEVAVLFHGYAAEKSQMLPVAASFRDAGWTTVLVDFRGSGGSTGETTTLGAEEADDVAAALRWTSLRLGDGEPTAYGFSMGAAAVLRSVARHDVPVDTVIAEASYGRLTTSVGHRFEAMGLPSTGLRELLVLWGSVATGSNGFDLVPEADAAQIAAPVWVLQGRDDPRVSEGEARRIAHAADGALFLTSGQGHQPLATSRRDRFDLVLTQIRPLVRGGRTRSD